MVHRDSSRWPHRAIDPWGVPPRGRHAAVKSPVTSSNRIIPIALLASTALLLLVFQYQFRHVEAATAAGMYGVLTPTLAASSAPIVWFGLGAPGAFGLVITPECSSALLLVPLCVLGIGLMIPRRLGIRRVSTALAVAAVMLVAGNLMRMGLIAAMIRLVGIQTGYELGHLVLGSVVSIVCIATSLVVLTVIVTGHGRQWAARFLPHGRRGSVA